MIECRLALARLNFVAAQVLLGLGVGGVLFCNWIVFLQRQFALTLGRTILRIYRRVIRSVIAQIAHQTDQLAFRILLCHNLETSLTHVFTEVNWLFGFFIGWDVFCVFG